MVNGGLLRTGRESPGSRFRFVRTKLLSIKLDGLLPGAPTIPEQIAGNKRPDYDALEAVDQRLASEGKVDVSALEQMLDAMLSTQLVSAAKEAAAEITKPGNQVLH